MRQTYNKNLADLNAFPWSNFLKLITGPTMKQWLLNWMDSFPEGLLTDGRTIEEAINSFQGSLDNLQLLINTNTTNIQTIQQQITTINTEIGKLWAAVIEAGGDPGSNPQLYTFSKYFSVIDNFVDLSAHYLALPYINSQTTLQSTNYNVETPAFFPSLSVTLNSESVYQISNNADVVLNSGGYDEASFLFSSWDSGLVPLIPKNNHVKVILKARILNAPSFDALRLSCSLKNHNNGATHTLSQPVINTHEWDNYTFTGFFTNVATLDADTLMLSVIATDGTTFPDGASIEIKDFSIIYYPDSAVVDQGLDLPVANLILSNKSEVPAMPPAGLTPDDEAYDKTSFIMPAQWAYNKYDDIWYYNTGSKIKALPAKFSEQFKIIDNVITFDAPVIKAVHTAETYELNEITANADIIEPTYLPIANVTLQGVRVKKLNFEMRLAVDNEVHHLNGKFGVTYNGISNAIFDGPDLSPIFKPYEWYNASYLTNINSLNLGLRQDIGVNVMVGTGSIFEIRNVVITDSNDNTYEAALTAATDFTLNTLQVEIPTELKGTRIQFLRLTQVGQQPTIPNPITLTPEDEAWLTTDIQEGEFAVNIPDKKVFWRAGNNIIEITGGSGGASERPNVKASTVTANGQTTTVDFNVINSNKVPFQDGVTTHTLAFQNMSTTEKNPAIVIDNTANNSGLVVTFNDQSGVVKFNEADGDFPGLFPQMNVAANQKYRIEFYSISATEIDLEFVPQNTLN